MFGETMTIYGLEISQEFLDWLEVSFTLEELESAKNEKDGEMVPIGNCGTDLDCVEPVKYHEYKIELLEAIRTMPRWMLTHRQRFGDPGFFTTRLPQIKKEMELVEKMYGSRGA